MKRWILASGSAAALACFAQAGLSLTAEEAWESWKAGADSAGYALTTEAETAADGSLTVQGLNASAAIDDMTLTAKIDQVVFTEAGDLVEVTLSDHVDLTLAGKNPEGEKVDAVLRVTQPDLKMTASDSDDGAAFAYDSPTAKLSLESLLIDDQEIPVDAVMNLSGLSGGHSFSVTDLASFTSDAKVESAELTLDIIAPDNQGRMNLGLTIDGIDSFARGDAIPVLDEAEPEDLFADGFGISASGKFGAVALKAEIDDAGTVTNLTSDLEGGHLDMAFNAEHLLYDLGYDGFSLNASGGLLPVPEVTAALERLGVRFEMPVEPADEAGPIGIRYAIEGLSLGEGIWSMIDPGGAVEHGPASLVVDVSGKVRWLVNIFDEANHDLAEMPGEVENIDINEITLDALGARLEGKGGFTFDNSDLQTIPGVPRPEGSVNLRLVGGNALLDGLTALGIVPAEQVMMVRMFSGMLAVPGPGEDELLTEVTVNPDGKILINGAPLPF